MTRYWLFVFLLFVFSCRNSSTEEKGTFKIDWEKDALKLENNYAQGFSIEKFKNYFQSVVNTKRSGNNDTNN